MTEKIDEVSIVTWQWPGKRDYKPEHVKLLGKSLQEYMTFPYRFIVITDNPDAGDFGNAEVIKTPENAIKLSHIETPEAKRDSNKLKTYFPSSYRRLWLFSEEAKMLGDKILNTDVDCVVTGNWLPLVNHNHSFVGWQPGHSFGSDVTRFAGGTWFLKTGAHTDVYDEFIKDPDLAISKAMKAGYRGSDQAWMSYKLRAKCPAWDKDFGIYCTRDIEKYFRDNEAKKGNTVPRQRNVRIRNRNVRNRTVESSTPIQYIPPNSLVIHFAGNQNPWDENMIVKHPWMAKYYK